MATAFVEVRAVFVLILVLARGNSVWAAVGSTALLVGAARQRLGLNKCLQRLFLTALMRRAFARRPREPKGARRGSASTVLPCLCCLIKNRARAAWRRFRITIKTFQRANAERASVRHTSNRRQKSRRRVGGLWHSYRTVTRVAKPSTRFCSRTSSERRTISATPAERALTEQHKPPRRRA